MGVTHVVRGKDLVMEDQMETRIWDILEVDRRPRFVHFGILRFKDLELSKSRYRREIAEGRLTGIDDPRTWTLQSLRRRGIRPLALREFVLAFGLSLNDIEVAAETLYAENRKMIDKDANRYFFVPDPVPIEIAGLPPVERVKAPLHPDFPGRGVREIAAGPKVEVAREDFTKFRGQEVRLKDFCNVVLDHRARFISMANAGSTTQSIDAARMGSLNVKPASCQLVSTSSGLIVTEPGTMAISSKPYARRAFFPRPI